MGVARIYKGFSPYPSSAIRDVDFAQSADVLYSAHLDYPLYKITRTSHTSWTSAQVTFGPSVATPAAPTLVASNPNSTGYTATPYSYVITAIGGPSGSSESRASPPVSCTNDLTLNGNFNTLTLPALPTGVTRWVIYKLQGGSYGYIGNTTSTTFKDGSPAILPILSNSPPVGANPFTGAGTYPSTLTFHQQRLMLGCSRNLPNAIWGTQSSDYENMDAAFPVRSSDALSFRLVGERVNSVNQMVSLTDLLVVTSNAIFDVNGGGKGDALTPAAIVPRRQSSHSGNRLKPIVLDNTVFYTPNRGTSVRAMGFQFDVDGYQSNNISIFSPHFFRGHSIVDWAYVSEPYSAIFAVREDGVLLCFTWEQEQQVWGWTLLDTPGKFLAVASITEGGWDRLYVVVERQINGVTRRFYERMALPHIDDITTACHLDCSVTQVYTTPQNISGGLSHLEGTLVTAYYDGYEATGLLVTNGSITLPNDYAATIVTAGIPYSGLIETLPLIMAGRFVASGQHINQQNMARLIMRTIDTRGLEVGITGAQLEPITERMGGEDGMADTHQRDYDISPPGHWHMSTTMTIQQNQSMPAHITGLFFDPRVSPV